MADNQYLTIQEIAQDRALTVPQVRHHLAKSGAPKPKKMVGRIGLWLREDLENWHPKTYRKRGSAA